MVVGLLDDERADAWFQALADRTRRDILTVVLQEEHSVSDLARRYPMTFAAVQKHVAVLERAELVTKRRRGREQLVRGDVETVRHVNRLLDELEALWRGRLGQLADVLGEPDHPDRSGSQPTPPGGPT